MNVSFKTVRLVLTALSFACMSAPAGAAIYRCEARCLRTADSVSPTTGAKRLVYEEMGCGKIHRDGSSPQEALRNLQAECTKRSGNRLLRSFTSIDASTKMASTSDLEPGTHLITSGTAKDATVEDCHILSESGSAGGASTAQ